MAITLPKLPYTHDALEPHMSRETLQHHYGKHHKTYVEKTNELAAGTPFEDMNLDDIVRESSGKLFNNAAQVWNHNFFWKCLTPKSCKPGEDLTDALEEAFGSVDNFKKKFSDAAAGLFGSGWTWLVENTEGGLEIVTTDNANNPLTEAQRPLLTCDVWEHAYYIDYRNARPEYLKHYWALVNWDWVESNRTSLTEKSGMEHRPKAGTYNRPPPAREHAR